MDTSTGQSLADWLDESSLAVPFNPAQSISFPDPLFGYQAPWIVNRDTEILSQLLDLPRMIKAAQTIANLSPANRLDQALLTIFLQIRES